MLRKLLAFFGVGLAGAHAAYAAGSYAPYAEQAPNQIYNLLFCDEPEGFKPRPGEAPAPWQATLFGEPLAVKAVEALANDPTAEGRIRALAYNRLRKEGHSVPPKQLLGVIVEVPLDDGLDVLAAFSDGGVRYINQTGKLAVFEGEPSIRPAAAALLKVSEAVVARIGPSDKPRMPPPKRGNMRLTFLVSDGLYFAEGPMEVMADEPLAGPVVQRATELLMLVVNTAAK
jgi:hypothetical protein